MAKKKKKMAIGAKACKIAAGVFFILVALSFLLSSGTRLAFLGGYVFAYLFGLVGYYGFPVLIILLSLGLFSRKIAKIFNFRFFIGALIAILSSCFLFSLIQHGGKYEAGQFGAFQELFGHVRGIRFGYSTDISLSGGALGFILATLFPSSLLWLGYLIASLLIAIALIILFFPLLKSLFKLIKASIAISKARRASARAMEEELAQEEEHERTTRIELTPPSGPLPEATPLPANPLDSLVFKPAGNTSLPSRTSRNPSPRTAEETPQQSYVHPSSPRPLPNPSRDLYSGNTLRYSGLRPAHFEMLDTRESSPLPPTPAPVMSELAAEPSVAIENPPRPMESEQPFSAPILEDLTPDFVPTASTRSNRPLPTNEATPAPTEPTSIFSTEEEEAPLPPIQAQDAQMHLDFDAPPTPLSQVPPVNKPVETIPAQEKKIDEEAEVPLPPYRYPPLTLLSYPDNSQNLAEMEEECHRKEEIINQTFADLKIRARVVSHTIGPSVTRYAIEPDHDVPVAVIGKYITDIETRLGGLPCRYSERVSGLTTPALETTNEVVRLVGIRECLEALPPLSEKTRMHIAFGITISGKVLTASLAEFPHLLLAGTTGSGKSVFVHSILLALLMRNRPEELKLVLVDPKRVEMTKYRDLPHLLCPIVKEPIHAKNALKKLVDEMERRYMLFDEAAVQKIEEYNTDYAPTYHKKKLPYIVLVVDEFADLVQNCKEVSEYVLTLGAKARAAGIHMIIATQRPDAKTISGTIKANLPTSVALSVRSQTDSMVILGSKGAEDLAGHGDMLIDCAQISKKEFVRAQGCFVDNKEIRLICDYIRSQQQVVYHPAFLNLDDEEEAPPSGGGEAFTGEAPPPPTNGDAEAKYEYVKSIIMTREYCSISLIQREFGVGFPRAGKIFGRLQKEGIVDLNPVSASKGCRVLIHNEPSSSSAGSVSSSTTEPSWMSDPEEDIS